MKQRVGPVLLALCAGGACAQPLYRCGNTYSEAACPGAQVVARAEAPSAARVAEARRDAERAKRLADDMERDRHRREASIRPAMAVSLSGPTKRALEPEAATSKPKRKNHRRSRPGAERDDFVAAVPGSTRKR